VRIRGVQLPCNRGAVPVKEGCKQLHPIRKEPSREPSIETKEPIEKDFRFGVVTYRQPPDEIDFADLWATNPGMAKMELRAIAPGHKRPEMVAHGFGQWWAGPGLNDFDECLIKACQKRKRKFQQPDSVGDAKTFINNMLRSGDWANFSLRCDEAKKLRDCAATIEVNSQTTTAIFSSANTLARSEAEQREVSVGLAKFKLSQGDIVRAKEIAKLHSIPYAEIGIAVDSSDRSTPVGAT